VFVHEHLYARCYFLDVAALDAWSNTPHEGTNRGSKHCENAVRPDMSQAESTKKLSEQDAERTEVKLRSISDSFYKTPLHSSSVMAKHITTKAESHLQAEMEEAKNYVSVRVDGRTWLVIRSVPRKTVTTPIPKFERVRMVTIDNGCMKCSCCSTDQYGIPDCHIAHVCLFYGTGFKSFSHHDIDLRHHTSYCQLVATKDAASMSDSELELRSSLLRARRMELPLPAAPEIFEFESGAKFSIGSNCSEEKIGGYAEIWSHIC